MIRWSLIGSAAVALSACGPDGVPVTISGFAATGAAMANANVTAKCVSGPQLTGTTDANGLFVLTLNNQTAPCIVRVTSGGVTLHSFADSSGRLNITPLTELSVGKALGADPATAFASFDGTKASTIANGLAAAKASIKTQVEALTGASIAGDLFTSTFRVGDPDDLVLDSLNNKLAAIGRPLSELVAAAAANKPLAPRVKVFGDSLSDSGTFGLKFTVQGTAATGAGSADIWVDLVAKQLQTARLCPYFSSTGSTFASRGECTNYAIGGGRVNYASNPADPRSIPLQLKTAAGIHGSYTADDVLLIVGGGNDAADLAGAWLGATTSQGQQAFATLLDSVLGAGSAASLLGNGSNPTAAVVAGISYMETLAGNLAAAIQEHAVGKGAAKVVVMNMPDITLTPRFSALLYGISVNPQAGPAQAEAVRKAIVDWVNAFNNSLANRFATSPASTKVAVLDFNTTFRAQVASPGTYGFTNGTDTACPPTGTDSSGLPTYTFPTCTATALSGQRPDWQTYMFSDGFHPTPLAHSKAADLAVQLIRDRGWN
jgi:phospholipase/lecithinase/hemolysin